MDVKKAAAAAITVTLAFGMTAGVGSAATTDDKLHATLRGDQVVPGPGDVNGKAQFKATIGEDSLCYSLRKLKAPNATAAHIHAGATGEAGDIVVTLRTPTGKKGVSDCIEVVPDEEDTELTLSVSELEALRSDPSGSYVDVHTERFPDGAIRGQLR